MSDDRESRLGALVRPVGGAALTRWRRRILRTAAFALLVLLGARLVWSGVEGWRLRRAVDEVQSRHGSLSLKTLAPPAAPDAENRAVMYRAAAEIVDLGRGGRKVSRDLAGSDPVHVPEEVLRSAESLLERNRLVLLLVAGGSRRPRANWEIRYQDGIEARLPDLRGLIDVVRLLQMKALLDIRAGRTSDAAGALEEGFALSSSLAGEPILIVQMVRQSMDRILLEAARTLLGRAAPAPAELERLARALPDERPAHFRAALDAEMKTLHDVLLRIESGREGYGRPEGGLLASGAAWILRPLAFGAHRRILLEMQEALETEIRPEDLRAGFAPREAGGGWNPFYVLTAPRHLEQARARAAAAEARSALARTAVALRRFRIESGAYPGSLGALVPSHLGGLPVDPFSGAPPAYAVEGGGFVLRSAGEGVVTWGGGPPIADELLVWRIPS